MNQSTLIIRDRLQLKAIINRLINSQSLTFDGQNYTREETATAIAEFLIRQNLLPSELNNKSLNEISGLLSQDGNAEILNSLDQFIDQGFKQETASLPQNLQELIDAKIQFDSLEQTQDKNISLGKLSIKQLIEIAKKNQQINQKWVQQNQDLANQLVDKDVNSQTKNQTTKAVETVNQIIAEQLITKGDEASLTEIRDAVLYNPQISSLGLKNLAKINAYTKNIISDKTKANDLKKTYLATQGSKLALGPNFKQIVDLFEAKGGLDRESAEVAASKYLEITQSGQTDPFEAIITAVDQTVPGQGLGISLANYLSKKPVFLKAIQNYQESQIIHTPQGMVIPENIVIKTAHGSKSIGQLVRIINRNQPHNEISATDLVGFLNDQNPQDLAKQLGISIDSQEFKFIQSHFENTHKTIADSIAKDPNLATYLPPGFKIPFTRNPQQISSSQDNYQFSRNGVQVKYRASRFNPRKNIFGQGHWLNNRLTARPTARIMAMANKWILQSQDGGGFDGRFKSFIGKGILGVGKKLGLNVNGLSGNIENMAAKYAGKAVNTAVTAAVASTGVGAPVAKVAGWVSEKVVQKTIPFIKKYGKKIILGGIGLGLGMLWGLLGKLAGVASNLFWAGMYAIPGGLILGPAGAIAGAALGYTTGSSTWKLLTQKIPSLNTFNNWAGKTVSNFLGIGNTSTNTIATQAVGTALGITAISSIIYMQYLSSIFALPPFEKGSDYYGVSGDIICKSPSSYPVHGWPAKGVISQNPDEGNHENKTVNSIDIAVVTGTPIQSTITGTATYIVDPPDAKGRSYGNLVIVTGNGISTYYAHLQRSLVKTGEHVDAGDTIGQSDDTGTSSGPHLHYEIRDANHNVNRDQVPIECTMGIKP